MRLRTPAAEKMSSRELVVTVVAVLCLHVTSSHRHISLPQSDTSDVLLPLKVCRIAAKVAARVNLIYDCNVACASAYYMLQQLHRCMAYLPMRTLDADLYSTEPARNGSSLSVFVLPETSEEAGVRVRQLTEWLFDRQRLKHIHKYIFVWRGAKLPELTKLLRLMWAKHILKVIVLTDTHRVFTYEPFTAHGFAVKLCPDGGDYFYDKLQNFHGFQVKISMFVDPQRAMLKHKSAEGYTAIDGRVAETVIRLLNATAKYITPADNQNYGSCRNGTFTGALKYISSGATHVGFNSRFNLDCMQSGIEELYPYRRRYLYLVVPSAKMRPEYRIFVDAFTDSLWCLIILNFLLVLFFFALLQRWVHNLPVFAHIRMWRWYEILEILYKTQLGEPVDRFERISSMREFLVAWIFFSYVLTTVYFGKLESSFVSPTFEHELNSLSELHRLNVPIYAVTNVFDAVEYTLEPKYWKLIKAHAVRLPLSHSAHPYAYNIVKKSGPNPKMAFILRDETAREFIASTYNNDIGRPTFHAVKEYLRSMPRTYIVTPGSPFLEKFQNLISSFYEFGFLEYWLDQDLGHRLLHIANVDTFQEELNSDEIGSELGSINNDGSHSTHKHVVLNLDILQGAFFVWLLGIIFSFIGLGFEYLYWVSDMGSILPL